MIGSRSLVISLQKIMERELFFSYFIDENTKRMQGMETIVV